jgi:3-deoxy-7-phosphoheptulonate synthase
MSPGFSFLSACATSCLCKGRANAIPLIAMSWRVGRMSTTKLENVNVEKEEILLAPDRLKDTIPMTPAAAASVESARATLRNILDRSDPRLFVVIGPCSIHDPAAALDYARRLRALADRVADSLVLVMRVYFEKPRTTVGWKGLINDPYLNDTFQIRDGLQIARQLLRDIAEIGLPIATEALDPISPQYLQDFIAWSAIGARTAESQTHREMASGLSSIIGFKNGTDGALGVAINALQSVANPHRFLGINQSGQVSVIHTRGNPLAHVVLRGGDKGPNYGAEHVAACEAELARVGVAANIMVDCSHANSSKDPARQPEVALDVAEQVRAGNRSIVGLMIESNIGFGNQKIPVDLSKLAYGVSVTDGCIDWATTEQLMLDLQARIAGPLRARATG